MSFTRSFQHWRLAVTATTLFAIVTGSLAVWFSAHPLDRCAHILLVGLSMLSAIMAVLAFRGRRGHFVVEGNACIWDTTIFKYRKHMLDLSAVTSVSYEANKETQKLVARLRDGSSVRLPHLYLFRSRDIAQFMDFLTNTHAHITVIGRDLLPSA